MITFLDTSAVIAALNHKEAHHLWSKTQIENRKALGPMVIVNIVYCELSYGMASRNDVDKVVNRLSLERAVSDDDALFRAIVAFKQYKENNKGLKKGVLPDFLIGAFAEVAEAALVTTNASDFRTYFPNVVLLSPD